MLHLSLLRLPRAHDRWKTLDLYQAHQLVWKAFPEVPKGERPFLFSLDDRGLYHSLLVQSTLAPAWDYVRADAEVQQKTFDPHGVESGSRARFFLRCNPTVARRDGSGKRGTRQPVGLGGDVPRETALRTWLEQQGVRGGFAAEPDDVTVGPSVRRVIVRAPERSHRERPIVLHEVEFTGLLTVTDADLFARLRAEGIGRGRSFGFGLLMLKPA